MTLPSLADVHASLTTGPARVRAMVSGLPHATLHANEGPDTWSPFQVVGHLVWAERVNWIPRVRVALDNNGGAFATFDRFAHLRLFATTPLGELLDELTALRAANLTALDALQLDEVRLGHTARHPEFGLVTVRQLLSTWALHDWAHLGQITRVVAKGYGEAVGPWQRYFSILRR